MMEGAVNDRQGLGASLSLRIGGGLPTANRYTSAIFLILSGILLRLGSIAYGFVSALGGPSSRLRPAAPFHECGRPQRAGCWGSLM